MHRWHVESLGLSKCIENLLHLTGMHQHIQHDLKTTRNTKKGCFLGCNSCSITELQGTQRYPKNAKNLIYHLSDLSMTSKGIPCSQTIFGLMSPAFFVTFPTSWDASACDQVGAPASAFEDKSFSLCINLLAGHDRCPTVSDVMENHGTGGRLRSSATIFIYQETLTQGKERDTALQQSTARNFIY